jgi:hypothetical protein
MATPNPGNPRTRGGTGKFVRTLDTVERDTKAARLRARGASFDEIATALEYSDRGDAFRAVSRALRDVPVQAADELRELENARLDELSRRAWQVINSTHYKVSNSGRVVLDPETQQPLIDPQPTLTAVNALLKISARRAALNGLDRPAKLDVNVTPETALDVINSEIARMTREIAESHDRLRLELPPGHPERLGD